MIKKKSLYIAQFKNCLHGPLTVSKAGVLLINSSATALYITFNLRSHGHDYHNHKRLCTSFLPLGRPL